MAKEPPGAAQFDRAFAVVFRASPLPSDQEPDDGAPSTPATAAPARRSADGDDHHGPSASGLADAILDALHEGDEEELRFLAARAVELHSGIGEQPGSQRYFLHRVLRAVDLTRMLTTEMQRLRRDEALGLTELELLLARNELARLLEDFRRELAAEIADRLARADDTPPPDDPPMTRDLLALSA